MDLQNHQAGMKKQLKVLPCFFTSICAPRINNKEKSSEEINPAGTTGAHMGQSQTHNTLRRPTTWGIITINVHACRPWMLLTVRCN
jgi:hypothetical protein